MEDVKYQHGRGTKYSATQNSNFPEATLILIIFCYSGLESIRKKVNSVGTTRIFHLIILNTDSSSVFVKPEWSAKIQKTRSYNAPGGGGGEETVWYTHAASDFWCFLLQLIQIPVGYMWNLLNEKYDDG